MSDAPDTTDDEGGVADDARAVDDERGITDEDMAQIAAYLQKPAHQRSVEDLQQSTDR